MGDWDMRFTEESRSFKMRLMPRLKLEPEKVLMNQSLAAAKYQV
jgi:hypothetical protein